MKDENIKDKEQWMDKLKEKLENYSEPVPTFGWEQLEKELVSPAEKRIIYPYRRWVAVAAVAILLIASSVSVYFLNSPVADEIRYAVVPELPAEPDHLPLTAKPNMEVPEVEPVKEMRPIVAVVRKNTEKQGIEPSVLDGTTLPDEEKGEHEVVGETVVPPKEKKETVGEAKTETKDERATVRPRRPSGKDKLHLPVGKPVREKGRWSVGAAVGNAGGRMDSENPKSNMNGQENGARINLASDQEDGTIRIPSDQMVVFKEGVPYLQNANDIVDIKHRQPIAFGLSVRKELPKGFSVETGVTYTLLSSDVKMVGNTAEINQKLHYIGIPLRANWNFLDKNRFTLYVAAGGMIEKCVYGKRGKDKLTIDPLQFSVSGAVGAQFNATKHVGIYVEPGVAYFFDDGSDIQTIRKETPCNFNIQGGIRFTY